MCHLSYRYLSSILRVRVRCSQNESLGGVDADVDVDQPAHNEVKSGSNGSGIASTAAMGAEAAPPGGRQRRGVSVCYPRVCVLQASSQAGGTFEDVVRFSVEPPPPPKVSHSADRSKAKAKKRQATREVSGIIVALPGVSYRIGVSVSSAVFCSVVTFVESETRNPRVSGSRALRTNGLTPSLIPRFSASCFLV